MSSPPVKEIHLVRELARKTMELASSDTYEARRRRWRDVNEGRRPDRAPVWCRPAGAWSEILPDSRLECEDPLCRGVERALRQHLYKDDVGDDHIVEPWWPVAAVFDCDTEYPWGVRTKHLVASTDAGDVFFLARNELNDSEFTGPTFSNDKKTLFANIQSPGHVLAIQGPFRKQR